MTTTKPQDVPFDICWHGDEPGEAIKADTIKDLLGMFYLDGDCDIAGGPGGLCFHHVFLSEDMSGPCVFVWGCEQTPTVFHCEYHAHTAWVMDGDRKAVANGGGE